MKGREVCGELGSPGGYVSGTRRGLDVFRLAYQETLDALVEITSDLTSVQWARPTGCPGWNVSDHLAHCVALEQGVADLFAHHWADRAAGGPRALGDPSVQWGGVMERRTVRLRRRLFDLVLHEQDIRRALGRHREPPPGTDQMVATHLLRLWRRHWPATVPGPGTVCVEVLTSEPHTLQVRLGDAGEQSRVLLRGSLSQLLPLAAGRSDAPDGSELFAAGDEQLARRVIAVAAVAR